MKYMFSLKFEANPVIEAESLEEAEEKAWELANRAKVVREVREPVRDEDGSTVGCRVLELDADDYELQEPVFLEEVRE